MASNMIPTLQNLYYVVDVGKNIMCCWKMWETAVEDYKCRIGKCPVSITADELGLYKIRDQNNYPLSGSLYWFGSGKPRNNSIPTLEEVEAATGRKPKSPFYCICYPIFCYLAENKKIYGNQPK